MRKLYKEFFYIPKQGKVREKVMFTRVVISVTIVIMCLIAMSFTAYAYFSCNITSSSNLIATANFKAQASISVTENSKSTNVTVIENNDGSYTADLKAGKIYTITLNDAESNSATTGYCILTATGSSDVFHTQQIGADETVAGGNTDKVTFQLKATANTTVTISANWGTSSYYAAYAETGNGGDWYITNGNVDDNKVVLIVNGISEDECDAKLKATPQTTDTDNSSLITDTDDNKQSGTNTSSVPTTESQESKSEDSVETEVTTEETKDEDITDTETND